MKIDSFDPFDATIKFGIYYQKPFCNIKFENINHIKKYKKFIKSSIGKRYLEYIDDDSLYNDVCFPNAYSIVRNISVDEAFDECTKLQAITGFDITTFGLQTYAMENIGYRLENDYVKTDFSVAEVVTMFADLDIPYIIRVSDPNHVFAVKGYTIYNDLSNMNKQITDVIEQIPCDTQEDIDEIRRYLLVYSILPNKVNYAYLPNTLNVKEYLMNKSSIYD